MALTNPWEREALVQVAVVQAGAGEKEAQNPAAFEKVARPVSLPTEEDLKWYLAGKD